MFKSQTFNFNNSNGGEMLCGDSGEVGVSIPNLMYLPMHIAMYTAPGDLSPALCRAGLLYWLLCRQLVTGDVQLAATLFHMDLRFIELFLFALLPEFGLWLLWDFLALLTK